jgi:acylphosphatase
VRGYVRNLDSGHVEVYAVGSKQQLSDLAGLLWKGPRYADVSGVEEQEAAVEDCPDFRIRH